MKSGTNLNLTSIPTQTTATAYDRVCCWIGTMKRSTGVLQSRRDGYAGVRGTERSRGASGFKSLNQVMAPSKLQCFSVACNDMPQLEFGDKIVLPTKVLLELQCLKVPTPMLFHIRQFGSVDPVQQHIEFSQYCSVQEFSAPEGQVFLPYWMMQNLQVGEGDHVVIQNVINVPRGIYCRLQPEDSSFLDVAADIGPKLLMESTLQRYSVMSLNETILIDYGASRYYVKVVELKPGSVVSLLGDVDLELDFAAPPASDIKRPKSSTTLPAHPPQQQSIKTTSYEQGNSQHPVEPVSSQAGVGRRLGDGACVVDSTPLDCVSQSTLSVKPKQLGTQSFQAARQKMLAGGSSASVPIGIVALKADTDGLAKDVKLAQAAFTSPGHRLGSDSKKEEGNMVSAIPATIAPSSSPPSAPLVTAALVAVCSLCLAEVAKESIDMHFLRCTRNPAYHKFECSVCCAKILKRDQDTHQHCPQCNYVGVSAHNLAVHAEQEHALTHQCGDCGNKFNKAGLHAHVSDGCPSSLKLCSLCGFKIKRAELDSHSQACSSRTDRCDVCLKYIKRVDFEQHSLQCTSFQEVPPRHHNRVKSNQEDDAPQTVLKDALACAYCSKSGFADQRSLKRHVDQDCTIARSFQAPLPTSQSTSGQTSDVRTLVQGKLKRRADARALPSQASLPETKVLTSNHLDPLLRPRAGPISSSNTRTSAPKVTSKSTVKLTQLDALPTKPPAPKVDLDPVDSLFVGNAIPKSNPSAPPLRLQRLQHNPTRSTTTSSTTSHLQR